MFGITCGRTPQEISREILASPTEPHREDETLNRFKVVESELERLQKSLQDQSSKLERESAERTRLEQDCVSRDIRFKRETEALQQELRVTNEKVEEQAQKAAIRSRQPSEKVPSEAPKESAQTNKNDVPTAPPPPAPKPGKWQKHVANGKRLLIRHVDPKLVHFDKPFFLAIVVGCATSIIFGSCLWYLLTSCTTTQSLQSGALKSQVNYIVTKRQSGATICLNEIAFYRTFVNEDDLHVLKEDICMPEARLLSRWPKRLIEDLLPAAKLSIMLPFAEEGLTWCADASYTTLEECGKAKGSPCTTCHQRPKGSPDTPDSVDKEAVFKMAYEETRCPVPSQMIGVALSWAQQAQTLVIVIFVFAFMGVRIVHQFGPHGKEGLWGALKQQAEADLEQAATAVGSDVVNSM